MSPDVQLLSALASLRRRWRQRVFLESLGWIVIRVTKDDLRDGGRVLVERVRRAIARRGVAA